MVSPRCLSAAGSGELRAHSGPRAALSEERLALPGLCPSRAQHRVQERPTQEQGALPVHSSLTEDSRRQVSGRCNTRYFLPRTNLVLLLLLHNVAPESRPRVSCTPSAMMLVSGKPDLRLPWHWCYKEPEKVDSQMGFGIPTDPVAVEGA